MIKKYLFFVLAICGLVSKLQAQNCDTLEYSFTLYFNEQCSVKNSADAIETLHAFGYNLSHYMPNDTTLIIENYSSLYVEGRVVYDIFNPKPKVILIAESSKQSDWYRELIEREPEVAKRGYYIPNDFVLGGSSCPFKMEKQGSKINYTYYDLEKNTLHSYTHFDLDTTKITRLEKGAGIDVTTMEVKGYRFTNKEQVLHIGNYDFICYVFESVGSTFYKEYRYVDKKTFLTLQSDSYNIKTGKLIGSTFIGKIQAY